MQLPSHPSRQLLRRDQRDPQDLALSRQHLLDRWDQWDQEQSMQLPPDPSHQLLQRDQRDPQDLALSRPHLLDRWDQWGQEQSMQLLPDPLRPRDQQDPQDLALSRPRLLDRSDQLGQERWKHLPPDPPDPPDPSHPLRQRDPWGLAPWMPHQAHRPGLSHQILLVRPVVPCRLVVRESRPRHQRGMRRLILADDSSIRSPCCRKILRGLSRIRQILDSIAGSAATSEPWKSHRPSRTGTPAKLKT